MGANQSMNSNSHLDQDDDVIMRDSHIDLELSPEIFEMLNHPEMDPPIASPAASPIVSPADVSENDGHIYLIREREFINSGKVFIRSASLDRSVLNGLLNIRSPV